MFPLLRGPDRVLLTQLCLRGRLIVFVCVCSVMSDSATPWTVACQASLSMEFFRQESLEWVALSYSGGGAGGGGVGLLEPGIEPVSPALPADCLPLAPW